MRPTRVVLALLVAFLASCEEYKEPTWSECREKGRKQLVSCAKKAQTSVDVEDCMEQRRGHDLACDHYLPREKMVRERAAEIMARAALPGWWEDPEVPVEMIVCPENEPLPVSSPDEDLGRGTVMCVKNQITDEVY